METKKPAIEPPKPLSVTRITFRVDQNGNYRAVKREKLEG
jgi:hypothetical protein